MMRTDGTVTQPRLKQVALSAISEVNAELYFADASRCWGMPRWQKSRRNNWTAKASAFSTISTRFTAGHAPCSTNVTRDYDATASGVKRGEELAEASGDLWRDARWAISRVQDAPHCTVELI